MTLEDARRFVADIRAAAAEDDDEKAHGIEDSLREDALKAIADGTAEFPRELARIALSTTEIEFSRWCA